MVNKSLRAAGCGGEPGERAEGGMLGFRRGVQAKHPPGPPMTLGNMRELGVHHLDRFLPHSR
jgi:hypothetical protein